MRGVTWLRTNMPQERGGDPGHGTGLSITPVPPAKRYADRVKARISACVTAGSFLAQVSTMFHALLARVLLLCPVPAGIASPGTVWGVTACRRRTDHQDWWRDAGPSRGGDDAGQRPCPIPPAPLGRAPGRNEMPEEEPPAGAVALQRRRDRALRRLATRR